MRMRANDLRSAHLHYTPINPKKVLAQLGEQFLRTLADKKSTGEEIRKKIITSANCNGNRYRCSPNAPQIPFDAIFPVRFI